MEKVEKAVEKIPRAEEKKKRKRLDHTAQEKCQAVLTLWTERGKPGEICREMGVAWGMLKQWQDRAMEGMLLALQPRTQVEKGVALSPRLAVLLEQKSRTGAMKGLDRRLKALQKSTHVSQGGPEIPTEKR